MATVYDIVPTTVQANSPLKPKVDINVGAKSHLLQPQVTGHGSLRTSAELLASSVKVNNSSQTRAGVHGSMSIMQEHTHLSPLEHESQIQSPLGPAALMKDSMSSSRKRAFQGSSVDLGYSGLPQKLSTFQPEQLKGELLVDKENVNLNVNARGYETRDRGGNVITRFAGVAGKAFLNWSTSFRGFHAGGSGSIYKDRNECDSDEKSMKYTQFQSSDMSAWTLSTGASSTMPGGFPQEDYIPDYMSHNHSTSKPATKRLRGETSYFEEQAFSIQEDVDPEPQKRSYSRSTTPCLSPERRSPHQSVASPSSSPRRLKHMSQAYNRRPPSSSFAGSPGLRSGRVSYASPRSHTPSPSVSPRRSMHTSTICYQRPRHNFNKHRRQETDDDANLERMNQQLKAMIRQGKEALGTTFVVEGGDEDDDVDTEED